MTNISDEILEAKIRRALLSGPDSVTSEATVAEMDAQGKMTVLRPGVNQWVCVPGNENIIGQADMCADPMGMQWMLDIAARKPKPTNTEPGLIYMLNGALQHSYTDPFDRTSPAIPIGPHWMILWPFDSRHCGLPTTVRDAGAWIMFAGTPYAYLHICGTPWDGSEYTPDVEARWTMRYAKPNVSRRSATALAISAFVVRPSRCRQRRMRRSMRSSSSDGEDSFITGRLVRSILASCITI